MIKRTLLILILTLIILLTITCECFSITEQEFNEIGNTLITICKEYNKVCTVKKENFNTYNAFTDAKGNIKIYSKLINDFSYSEVEAVGLHEVAHVVLEHPKERITFMKNNKPTIENRKKLRRIMHRQEYECDIFSVRKQIELGRPAAMPIALVRLRGGKDKPRTSYSHPSPTRRIIITSIANSVFRCLHKEKNCK